jgi:hypothetical protein
MILEAVASDIFGWFFNYYQKKEDVCESGSSLNFTA